MQSASAATGMRLGDYFQLVRRHWFVVLLSLILGVGLAVAYLKVAPREYQATTSVLVEATNPDASATDRAAINLDTEAQLVTSTETVAAAAKTLHASATDASKLTDNVSVTVPPNTEILDITYTGTSAKGAVAGSAAFAQAYLDQRKAAAEAVISAEKKSLQDRITSITTSLNAALKTAAGLTPGSADRARADSAASQLNGQLSSLNSQLLKVNTETVTPGEVVTQARTPDSPSSPNKLIALAAGILLGLVLGVGVAALRHRADDVIRTPEDLFQRTRVPVAAVLSARLHDGEVALLQPLSADGRGYARLRNLVTTSLEGSRRRVVLVAGVRRGAGPVAANLAASLARAGEEVVLVCADVFGNTATALLADAPSDGLAEVLAGERDVDTVVRRLAGIPTLRVLGAGHDVDRADALLQTRSPRTLIDRLLESATYVIIEAPPTTDSPDAQTLASGAELAVLVVEAGPTNAREVVDACAQLESMGTPVLGAVIGRYGRDSDPDRRTGEPAVGATTDERGTDVADDTATTTEEETPAAPDPSADAEKDAVSGEATWRTSPADVPLPAAQTPSSAPLTPVPPANGLPTGERAPGAATPSGGTAPTGATSTNGATIASNGNGGAPAGAPSHLVPPGSRGPVPR
jgi:capsular polysaccharide biosynthesis protein/Mrp family chromosome partitioning ATPase